MQKRGEEGLGRAEACVIVQPQLFDPGCGSCCYLEHLYLIRGKWVVRERGEKREKFFPSYFLCSVFYIFLFIPACVIPLLSFLDLNALHPVTFFLPWNPQYNVVWKNNALSPPCSRLILLSLSIVVPCM